MYCCLKELKRHCFQSCRYWHGFRKGLAMLPEPKSFRKRKILRIQSIQNYWNRIKTRKVRADPRFVQKWSNFILFELKFKYFWKILDVKSVDFAKRSPELSRSTFCMRFFLPSRFFVEVSFSFSLFPLCYLYI